jgi:hypothetical protein
MEVALACSFSLSILREVLQPRERLFAEGAFRRMLAVTNDALVRLKTQKLVLDRALLAGEFKACNFAIVEFKGPLALATTGTMGSSLRVSTQGLVVSDRPEARWERLSLSMDVTESSNVIVLSWLPEFAGSTQLVDELLGLEEECLLRLLPQLILLSLENTFFSLSWWGGLSAEDQRAVYALAMTGTPFQPNVPIFQRSLVPWTELSVAALTY